VRTELRKPSAIVIAVQDSGPGIDPNKLDDIFDAFVSTKAQGMGLGLAICRMIVERHGGQLTASSDGTSGALFQVNLPIGSADGGPVGEMSPVPAEALPSKTVDGHK
jgi:signal transduction histidine kinase